MTPPESSVLASEPVISPSTTAAANHDLASTYHERDNRERRAWDAMIDGYLVEWARDPTKLQDDDLVAPSARVIHRACQVALDRRDAGWAAPLRVVPDGEGGIRFERRSGAIFQSLNICEDLSIELETYEDCKLVRHQFLD